MLKELRNLDPTVGAVILGIGIVTPYVFDFFKGAIRTVSKGKKEESLKHYAAIEMGGTNYKLATANVLVDKKGVVKHITIIKNHQGRVNDADCEQTIKEIGQFFGDVEFDFIGVASFGPLCLDISKPEFGSITSTPKLNWKNFPILNHVRRYTKAKAYGFDTDVNAPALAELRLGTHKESLVYVTVGTGVGVGVVVNGNTVHGLLHPEGGHIIVNRHPDEWSDFQSVCPYHKNCLEGFVTNNAIASRYGIEKTQVEELDDSNRVWRLVGFYLAQLCYNLTLIVSPEVIVLGGGIMNRKVVMQYVHEQFLKMLNGYLQHPRLQSGNLDEYIRGSCIQHLALKGALMLRPIQ